MVQTVEIAMDNAREMITVTGAELLTEIEI